MDHPRKHAVLLIFTFLIGKTSTGCKAKVTFKRQLQLIYLLPVFIFHVHREQSGLMWRKKTQRVKYKVGNSGDELHS